MLSEANIELMLFSLPIYQLLFFTIQLVSFKKSNPARKYLGLLLISMTLFLLINALYYSGNDSLMEWLYIFFIPLLLTLTPLFFLYLISLINGKNHLSRLSKMILFIPPLLLLILNLFTYGLSPFHNKLLFITGDQTILSNSFQTADSLLFILWFGAGLLPALQLAFTIVKANALLKKEKAEVLEHPSHLAWLQFRWIYIIAFSMLVFISAAASQILFISSHNPASTVVFNLLMLISSGLAGYFGMKQDELFTNVSSVGFVEMTMVKQDYNDPASNLKVVPDDEAVEIIQKIELHLINEKPYLDKRFTINELSRQTGVSRKKLTFVINEVMEKNFYSLINDYRVREAMEIMRTNGNSFTMDTVADKSGFQSRSSFYGCFKKFTGQTPREFMVSVKQDDQPGENKLA